MQLFDILETIFIGPLKLVFEIIFQYALRLVNNPGLAIVALSLVMNILVLPLYKRADAVQEEARDIENKLAKGTAHIKKTFSGNERMMMLQTYNRQNNYKPTDVFKGSISLLLEIPFFMAAYQFLSHLQTLNGVSFGPISDLGKPDGLLVVFGITLNLLPILMTLINVISSAIYLKGFPLKTKIQLYGMALFFLVFLYTSPAGLLFYWTLNNVFSLFKNIFYKIKNPAKVIRIMTLILGALSISSSMWLYPGSFKKKLFMILLGVCLTLPFIINLIKTNVTFKQKEFKAVPNKKIFFLSGLFLTIFIGVLIPSTFIKASPQEYVDITYFHNPLWYIVSSVSMAAGFFLVWFRVFYWLAQPKLKVTFERIMFALCGMAIINYMFFGTKLGIISSSLVYENGLKFATSETVLNIVVLVIAIIVLTIVLAKWSKAIPSLLLTLSIAIGAMCGMNIYKTNESINSISIQQSDVMPNFTLSKTGENVVVLMLDRALGSYLPYLIEERPELKEQFSGFTCYTNVISYGSTTNFASPALFGGYEYTPVELNKRDKELLKDKQNEALKVLPVLFDQNGYEVTVCDPVYANYQYQSDTSIYDEYPDINTFVTEGAFSDPAIKEMAVTNNHRNFFCFSLMKSIPLFLQPFMYDNGTYVQATISTDTPVYTIQTITEGSTTVANGVGKTFMDAYNVLLNLPNITKVTNDSSNTFLMMVNNTTHEPNLLQKPDYIPALNIDNTEYDKQMGDSITANGNTMDLSRIYQKTHHQINMAAMIQLGNWFDSLKEQGVYDNTKIILVSDHGRGLVQFDEFIYGNKEDGQAFHPLLMVKDFNSKEFTINDEFMTNADVPTLATKDNINNPVNPFTNKPITNEEKTLHDQYITLSADWDTNINNGTQFTASRWAKVKDNIWDKSNWSFYYDSVILTEHKFPNE